MRLSRWFLLIAAVVGLGCLFVAQRTATVLKGYAVGERMHRVHARENETAWLKAHVVELASPTHLAEVAEEQDLKLVGWLRLPPATLLVGAASPDLAAVPPGMVTGQASLRRPAGSSQTTLARGWPDGSPDQ